MTSIFYERDLRIPSLLNMSHGIPSTDVPFINAGPPIFAEESHWLRSLLLFLHFSSMDRTQDDLSLIYDELVHIKAFQHLSTMVRIRTNILTCYIVLKL